MSEQEEQQRLLRRLSKLDDAIVLMRMRSLGLWPQDLGIPPDPPEESLERTRLAAELKKLGHGAKQADIDKALREERMRRFAESKQRRAQKKAQRETATAAAKAAWQAEKATRVVHAGNTVSAQLDQRAGDPDKLARYGLPQIADASALAQCLGLTLSQLRWLTYHRGAATLVHYHRYGIPKKTGGIRAISAPKPLLADAQAQLLTQILQRLPSSDYAHGFVPGRSSLSNASQHVGRALLINLDLKDFFPSIGFKRVRGLFRALGYSGEVASLLALLCTEPPRVDGVISGDPRKRVFHVALGERVLPQGACTSPALTNLLCQRLDVRLSGIARHFAFTYTRYADDLSFSGDTRESAGRLLGAVRRVLRAEDFVEHPDKTHVMPSNARQEVTGLVVNQGVGLKREDKRRLRAMLHNAAKHGMASQNREQHPHFASYLSGWVAYACMVEPAAAATWRAALAQALEHP